MADGSASFMETAEAQTRALHLADIGVRPLSSGRLRWMAAFTAVVLAFCLPVCWSLLRPPPPRPPIPPETPVVMVELSRPAAPPQPPSERPPGPVQAQATAPSPRAVERLREPQTEVAPVFVEARTEPVSEQTRQTPAPATTAPPVVRAPPAQAASSIPPTWQGSSPD